uniref:Uncharacterized protein n=1 Tax=Rhizophora mucronata TaxID=61149 RepID=A0A2P2IV41_RHIMU
MYLRSFGSSFCSFFLIFLFSFVKIFNSKRGT